MATPNREKPKEEEEEEEEVLMHLFMILFGIVAGTMFIKKCAL